jgi:hypothetical protein
VVEVAVVEVPVVTVVEVAVLVVEVMVVLVALAVVDVSVRVVDVSVVEEPLVVVAEVPTVVETFSKDEYLTNPVSSPLSVRVILAVFAWTDKITPVRPLYLPLMKTTTSPSLMRSFA